MLPRGRGVDAVVLREHALEALDAVRDLQGRVTRESPRVKTTPSATSVVICPGSPRMTVFARSLRRASSSAAQRAFAFSSVAAS